MTRFEALQERSEVVLEANTSVHPIRVKTNRVNGLFEAELDNNGKPDFSQPFSGWLEISVNDLKSGNPLLDRVMPGHLDTRRYPTITAELIEIYGENGDGQYHTIGDITFHGVTQRFENTLTISNLDETTLAIRGEILIDVRDFEVHPPKLLMFKLEPEVNVLLNSVVRQVSL